jgi:hypothetical protein
VGSSFFKEKAPSFGGGNPGLEARAIGSIGAGARGASIGAQKDIAAAQAINKHPFKPLKRSAAYPPGPKT